MDTSEQYIKMCWKAGEIQVLRRPGHPEDWLYGDCWSGGVEVMVVLPLHFPVQGYIWLPRQDQLQDMVFTENWRDELHDFVWQITTRNKSYYLTNPEFNSVEQLWLAFVMEQRYGKAWDGEAWILTKTLSSNH